MFLLGNILQEIRPQELRDDLEQLEDNKFNNNIL